MAKGYRFSDEPEIAERLQRLSREQMKLRLLQDIRVDMAVCELEGWGMTGYIEELITMLVGLRYAGDREKISELRPYERNAKKHGSARLLTD